VPPATQGWGASPSKASSSETRRASTCTRRRATSPGARNVSTCDRRRTLSLKAIDVFSDDLISGLLAAIDLAVEIIGDQLVESDAFHRRGGDDVVDLEAATHRRTLNSTTGSQPFHD